MVATVMVLCLMAMGVILTAAVKWAKNGPEFTLFHVSVQFLRGFVTFVTAGDALDIYSAQEDLNRRLSHTVVKSIALTDLLRHRLDGGSVGGRTVEDIEEVHGATERLFLRGELVEDL